MLYLLCDYLRKLTRLILLCNVQVNDSEYDAERAECDKAKHGIHKSVHVVNSLALVFLGQEETDVVNFELIHLC